MITAGETPAALSSRDGRLLRRLQDGSRLTPAALVQRLQVLGAPLSSHDPF